MKNYIIITIILWQCDLSYDLVSNYIQQHSTKSTNYTYLSPCSWQLTRMVCWKTDQGILKAWKVRPEKLSTKEFVDQRSMKAWKARPECKKNK